jgi:hypothetical protein
MKSAQGIYPIIPDNDTAFAFVEFVHCRGTTILQSTGGSIAPPIYVSLMEGARNHVTNTGSKVGKFKPNPLSQAPEIAKHFLPKFTIRFHQVHHFVPPARSLETLEPRDYQGQLHWHDGQGRMTIDASSYPLTTDGSGHSHFSADFAYYSLPILLKPVIHAWSASKTPAHPTSAAPSPLQAPRHELATT